MELPLIVRPEVILGLMETAGVLAEADFPDPEESAAALAEHLTDWYTAYDNGVDVQSASDLGTVELLAALVELILLSGAEVSQ